MAAILPGSGRGPAVSASAQLDAISTAAEELNPEPTGTVEFMTPRKPLMGSPASCMAQAVAATYSIQVLSRRSGLTRPSSENDIVSPISTEVSSTCGRSHGTKAIQTSRSIAAGSTKPRLKSVYSPMRLTRPGARTMTAGSASPVRSDSSCRSLAALSAIAAAEAFAEPVALDLSLTLSLAAPLIGSFCLPSAPRQRSAWVGGLDSRLESFGCVFGADVSLRFGQELISDHELAHGRLQQRRVEVGVELPVASVLPVERCLVPTHRVRERHVEQPVVTAQQISHGRGKAVPLVAIKLGKTRDSPARDQKRLVGPGRPIGNDEQPLVVAADASAPATLLSDVVEEKSITRRFEVAPLGGVFSDRFPRQGLAGPDLAVRMRIGGAHRGAVVLEDLDPAKPAAELRRLRRPEVYDTTHILAAHAGQSHIVAGREADHHARAARRIGAEQPFVDPKDGRVRLERCVVVSEDESRFVARIALAVGADIAGAEVTSRVVPGLRGLRRGLR